MSALFQKARAWWTKYSGINAETYASSIAYYSFLSIVPLLALCISLVSMAGLGEQEVVTFFTVLVPDALDSFVAALIEDAFDRSGLALSLSTLSLLWSASKGVKALRRGLNVAYGEEESRSAVVVIAISILAVAILGVLLAAMMYLIFSESVVLLLARLLPDLGEWDLSSPLDTLRTLAMAIPVITACYAYLPAGTRRFVSQLPGGVLSSLGCAALSYGFRVYMDVIGDSSMLYGSMATVVLFLYWMYLVSLILITGGFVNRLLSERKSAD